MASVYIVKGQTGEERSCHYNEYKTWEVAVYLNEEAANNYCKILNDWCLENGLHINSESNYGTLNFKRKLHASKCSIDPLFSCHYPGTIYKVFELELKG